MAVKKYGKKNYQIEFQAPGMPRGRVRLSSGSKSKATAEAYEKLLLTLYQHGLFYVLHMVLQRMISLSELKSVMDNSGIPGVVDLAHTKTGTTAAPELAPLIDEWLASPELATAADSTRADHATQTGGFLTHMDRELNGEVPEEDPESPAAAAPRRHVTVEHLETTNISGWLLAVEATPSERYPNKRTRSPKTVLAHRAALSSFCGWLVEKGLLPFNPCQKAYRPRVPTSEPVYFNRKQWPLFREASRAYDAERIAAWTADPEMHPERPYPDTLFWEFLVASGATTWNEGCQVRPADVRIDDSESGEMVRVWIPGTKTANRPRFVYISRQLAKRLIARAQKWGRSHFQPIFPFGKNEGSYVWEKVKQRLLDAGYGDFRPHTPYSLRHTYGVNMIMGDPERKVPGVDIFTLAKLMGHGDNINTTRIYARHAGEYAQLGCATLHRVLGLDGPPDAVDADPDPHVA